MHLTWKAWDITVLSLTTITSPDEPGAEGNVPRRQNLVNFDSLWLEKRSSFRSAVPDPGFVTLLHSRAAIYPHLLYAGAAAMFSIKQACCASEGSVNNSPRYALCRTQ